MLDIGENMKVISSDLLRGHIDTFVLSALMDGTKYGNEIRRFIAKKTNELYVPNEQSLYSAYHRLEDMECIKGVWGENVGATRKYYTITEKGRTLYERNKREWENAKRLIDILII
jgi:DNA-binding PadR family transcriptional regulator